MDNLSNPFVFLQYGLSAAADNGWDMGIRAEDLDGYVIAVIAEDVMNTSEDPDPFPSSGYLEWIEDDDGTEHRHTRAALRPVLVKAICWYLGHTVGPCTGDF
jgi:hypothetical protein